MVHNLGSRLKSGAIWTFFGFGFQKALQLSSSLILTRILFPEAFGLMAIVNVFIMGLVMLSDVGIKPAIIQMNRGGDPHFLNTAWTIQIIRGFLLWAVLCVLAKPIADFYEQPELFGLLIFSGFISVIGGFKSINVALADRDMRIKRSIAIKVVGQVVSLTAMITLALLLNNVWALAIGTLIGACFELLAGYVILKGHKHKLLFDRASAFSLLQFGKWIFLSTLLCYVGGQGTRLIQGAYVSIEELGVIAIAATISLIPNELVQQFMSKLVFPALSMVNRDKPEAFARTLSMFRVKIVSFVLPFFLLVSVFSSLAVDILYDDRYRLAGPILCIMVLGESFIMLTSLYKNALLSMGRVSVHFMFDLCLAVFRISGMIIGFYIGGVIGMFLGLGAGGFLYFLVVFVVAQYYKLASMLLDAAALLLIATVGAYSIHLNVVS